MQSLKGCSNLMEQTTLIQSKHNGKAIAGMVLGIIGLIAWLIPLFGLPINVVGLVMGSLGLKSENKRMAKAGVITSSIGLILTIINGVLGALIRLKYINL